MDKSMISAINSLHEWKGKLCSAVGYLAQPYSGNPVDAYTKAIKWTNLLADKGLVVYSPIALTHNLHLVKNRVHGFWLAFDTVLLDRLIDRLNWEPIKCLNFQDRQLFMLFAPNYEKSIGCHIEMEWGNAHHVGCYDLMPLLEADQWQKCERALFGDPQFYAKIKEMDKENQMRDEEAKKRNE